MTKTSPNDKPEGNLDLLVEDIAGLNIRGLRTISDLLIRLRDVFAAAHKPDWGGRYTPSIRLVFSLLIVVTVLRYFWASQDSPFVEVFQVNLERIGLDEDTAAQQTQWVFNAFIAVFPVAVILAHFVMAWVLRIWGAEVSAITRIRLYFLGLVPNSSLTVLMLFLVPLLTLDTLLIWTSATALVAVTLDGITAWRGGVAGNTLFERGWRAVLFAMCSLLATNLASITAFVGVQLVFIFV